MNNEISFQDIRHGTKLESDRDNEKIRKFIRLTSMDSCNVRTEIEGSHKREFTLCAGILSQTLKRGGNKCEMFLEEWGREI